MSDQAHGPVDWREFGAASIDGVGVLDGDEYVYTNRPFADVYGYDDPDELVGTAWQDRSDPDECKRIASEVLPQVHEEGHWRGETVGRRRDGETIPLELSLRATESELVVWIVRDAAKPDHRERDRRRSNDRDRGLAATDSVPIWIVTAERKIVYCNPAAATVLGVDDPDAVLGRTPAAFIHEDDRAQARRRFQQVIDEREATEPFEGRLVGLDEDKRTVELRVTPVAYEGEPAAQVVIDDVSSHERTNGVPENEQQFTRTVIDALEDVLYVVDENDDMIRWNDRLNERLGYTDEEIAKMGLSDFLTEADRNSPPESGIQMADRSNRTRELDLETAEGEAIPHELREVTDIDEPSGERYRVGIARDITERRRRQHERERYETIIETVKDGVYILDDDLRFSFVNDALCETFGRSREELLGTPAIEFFVHDDERALADEMRERVVNGDTDIGSIEGEVATPDGEIVYLEARYRPYPEPDGEYRGSVGVIRDITERKEREQELRAARQFNEELVENAPFGMFRLDEELRITYENPRAEEIIGLPDEMSSSDAIGVPFHELPSVVETGQAEQFTRLQDGETVEFEFPFESIYDKEAYFTGRTVPLYRDDEFDGAILMATDISERRRQERELEHQRDELETLNRINDLLLEITRELLGRSTREQIEHTVCDRLAASELYQFAWIGEPEADGDQLVARASAGVDDGYVEAITVTADGTETGQGPSGRALRTGDVQVSQNIRTDPAFEPWREAALDRDIQSAAAIPLLHGVATYGCLAVYTTRPLGFSQREQRAFELLGEAVGFAIHAIETRRLLFADAVLELEFRITDSDQFLIRHSERFECELSVSGYVATKSGGWLLYVGVQGASPEAVCEAATGLDELEHVRVVRDGGDEGLLEYRFAESTLLGTLTEAGVKLGSADVDAGTGRLVVEAPQDAAVRNLVDRIRDVAPTATLLAQRERDRSAVEFDVPGGPIEKLTDRQREALETAYHAGYFEWPRESTATEVAESMGIAAPTLNRHFRRAQHKLLSTLFDSMEDTAQ